MAKAYEELELNRCSEDTALTLNDGTVKIILNTKGTLDDVSPEMKRLLDYIMYPIRWTRRDEGIA